MFTITLIIIRAVCQDLKSKIQAEAKALQQEFVKIENTANRAKQDALQLAKGRIIEGRSL